MVDPSPIPLRQGRNIWRLWRTDRDGASRSAVTETVGPAVSRMLRPAGMGEGPWEILRTDSGGNPQWRIGAARPVELVSLERFQTGQPGPSMSAPSRSVLIADRQRYPGSGLPTVSGQRPWWIVVDLWWRRPDTTIPWPGFRVTWLGAHERTVLDADWVLERAMFVPPAVETHADPGDESSAESHAERAEETLKVALPPVALLALLGLALYADSTTSWRKWIG